MKQLLIFFALIYSFGGSLACWAKSIEVECLSPLQFGLLDAETGIERYNILLNCHKEAIRQRKGVSYSGISSLYIEVPMNTKSAIPVSSYTDFAGVEIHCKYRGSEHCVLFNMVQPGDSISISATDIDKGIFDNYAEITEGLYLLRIKDDNPWIKERIGYGYSHFRHDMMVVNNGKGLNTPVMPYDNDYSKINISYCRVSPETKIFKNLKFIRDEENTAIVRLLYAVMQYNLSISDIWVTTPQDNDLWSDGIFVIRDCAKVIFSDIRIDGTYSQTNKYGYAFDLSNIYDFKAIHLHAFGRWGVFGTNNIQKVYLEDSDLNRIDIHCYGRDVKCKGCRFKYLYNQFSCTYGNVEFDGCTFDRVTPYINGSSYNAYVPLNLKFNNCTFILSKKKCDLIQITGMTNLENSRLELKKKALPNVEIENCIVMLDDDVKAWRLFNLGDEIRQPIAGINKIIINGLDVSESDVEFSLFNRDIITENKVYIKTENMNVDLHESKR